MIVSASSALQQDGSESAWPPDLAVPSMEAEPVEAELAEAIIVS